MSTRDLQIAKVEAFPSSFPVTHSVTLGVGRAVKRDTVIVKVTTEGGLVGWGEAHHGKAPGAVGHLINTTLRQLALGMDATDVVGVWNKLYRGQVASHGMGAGAVLGISGIDQALWDIRGKAVGWPLYKLLGGRSKALPAYAGGISLGYQPPGQLVEETQSLIDQGYRAVKLRFGDSAERDVERFVAVRKAFGSLGIMVDANTGYTLEDVRRAMPALEEHRALWLEEPFPPHDHRSYRAAAALGRVPLAAGENHFTRFEFTRVLEDGSISVLQPDLSKSGGITECLRIAAMASAYKMAINPHTSASVLNMAASLHFLCAIDNPGWYEADAAKENLFRDLLAERPDRLDADGCVRPSDRPGLGVDINEEFVKAHPVIEGPAYV